MFMSYPNEEVSCTKPSSSVSVPCLVFCLEPYAECNYAECHFAEFHFAECHFAECHFAECHFARCHGAMNTF